jgi:succinate dehydrogenase/fumarate reductase flavoprotein subunit
VKRLGRTLVTDLLKHDGRVVGAVGFNTRNGDFYIFKAAAVVIATGESGWKASYHANTATGEGTYLGFRAGAKLKNYEFARVWNVPKPFAWESQTTLIPLGARFVNARGEAFMERYCPELGGRTDQHYNVIAMAIEAREGRGPIYFDVSRINPDNIDMVKPQTGWQLLNYRKLVDVGMDFFKDKIEWMPQLWLTSGGFAADIDGSTGVPGLFVTGMARSVEPGLCIGGLHLCVTAVTGHITGGAAAEYSRTARCSVIDENEVHDLKTRLYKPFAKPGISPKSVLTKIQQAVFPYDVCILKNETSLKNALDRIERIKREDLPQMTAADGHYLMKLVEVQAITFITELFLRASLMRTETRAGHYREDYPNRDDENWMKWIVINQGDGKINLQTEPVPIHKYPFKPVHYYMDNFKLNTRP